MTTYRTCKNLIIVTALLATPAHAATVSGETLGCRDIDMLSQISQAGTTHNFAESDRLLTRAFSTGECRPFRVGAQVNIVTQNPPLVCIEDAKEPSRHGCFWVISTEVTP